ncbi:MAG: metallophosphoesterase [Verrucomicrobiota bacterium]|nr:metallophosphoesterase [Verrucomicrobiota bacterium]
MNYYSEWKYFEGRTEASIPNTAWKETNFDDSGWKTGPSGFSVGFGSYNAPTKLEGMPGGYSSVFLRKRFNVEDIDWIKSLILRVDYDDGFVAYLNGTELVRRGLEGETNQPVPFNSLATLHPRGNPELIDLTQFTPLLKQGENVLAIQAHNHQLNDNWFAYYVELLANVVRGPFIQATTSTSTKVAWNTHAISTSIVEYGLTPKLGLQLENSTPRTKHVLQLENLEQNQTYYYRVGGKTSNGLMFSQPASFKTMKTSGPVKLMLLGDTGRGNLIQNQIATLLRREKPEAVMIAGDLVYPDFRPGYEDFRHFSVYKDQMKSVPFFTTIGNHDLYQGDTHYINAFYLPTNNLPSLGLKHQEVPYRFSGTEHFYSFDVGDAHISVLYNPWYAHHNFSKDTNQLHWLTNDLAKTSKPWKLLLMHFPVASSSGHGWSSYDGNAQPDTFDFGNTIYPIVSKYKIDLMMAGHSHAFEKFNPVAGCIPVVSGAGGANPYSFYRFFPGSLQYWPKNNAARISIKGDQLKLEALDTNGEVFDWFVINRKMPDRDFWPSAWQTPMIESKPSNDKHGNIFGQEFDFIGEPIPCIIGNSANLGQVRVNNDSTHLYIGFEQTMIRPNQNVFLFIDPLKESGVNSLKGLGDGILQFTSSSEGADGLDFLENLTFENFNPSVAAILGDEKSDTQSRNFARPGLNIRISEGTPPNNTSRIVPFPLGQGAFLLDQKFRDLPGIRFQQFNRSPQQFSQPQETDASFIELAIPFSSLENIQPGEEIKLGAVVGAGGINTQPNLQYRQLETTYLGKTFKSKEGGFYQLEGIKVKLAENPDPDSDQLPTDRELEIGTDPVKADTDGDYLPDGWEVARGLNPIVHDGEKAMGFDPDGDGMNNREELTAGTDPLNPDSNLKLEARSIPDGVRLTWIAQPNIRYKITASDQVNGPYIVLGQEHSHGGTNPIEMKISLNWPAKPNNKPEAYFQIQVSP